MQPDPHPNVDEESPRNSDAHLRAWIQGSLLIAALLVLLFLVRQLPVAYWITNLHDLVSDLGFAGLIVYIAVFALTMVLFVPGTPFALGAGFAFGLGWGMVAATVGATLGATGGFLIARYAARDWVRGWAQDRRKLQALDRAVSRRGWRIVALLRVSPVFPFPVLNYVLGLTGVRLISFIVATWVGILPATFFYVAIGYAGRASLEAPGTPDAKLRLVLLGVGLVVTLGVTLYLTAYARRVLRQEAGTQRS